MCLEVSEYLNINGKQKRKTILKNCCQNLENQGQAWESRSIHLAENMQMLLVFTVFLFAIKIRGNWLENRFKVKIWSLFDEL